MTYTATQLENHPNGWLVQEWTEETTREITEQVEVGQDGDGNPIYEEQTRTETVPPEVISSRKVFVSTDDNTAEAAIASVTAPPAPPLPKYPDTASAMRDVVAYINSLTAKIGGDVPVDEKASWTQKLTEAEAWTADNTAATPILSVEAQVTGEPLADLVARVSAKGAQYKAIAGGIAGFRRSIEAQLDAVETSDEREAILAASEQQALALLADAGIAL
jgi:hypothetical protein